jgi:hypothetical protein
MGVQEISDSDKVKAGDVVLAATQEVDAAAQKSRLESYKNAGAFVILIGSKDKALRSCADAFIRTGLPVGTAPVVSYKTGPACPAAGVA